MLPNRSDYQIYPNIYIGVLLFLSWFRNLNHEVLDKIIKMATCIDRILEFYENQKLINTPQGRIFLSQVIIRLMKELDEGHSNFLEVRNCLILLLNLFTNIEAPDHYHSKGKSVEELTEKEKRELFGLLKSEINKDLFN